MERNSLFCRQYKQSLSGLLTPGPDYFDWQEMMDFPGYNSVAVRGFSESNGERGNFVATETEKYFDKELEKIGLKSHGKG